VGALATNGFFDGGSCKTAWRSSPFTLAAFASRSVISTPPRFAINYSVRATLAVFAETHRLRTSDAERDQEASRKPSLRCYTGITYSIKSFGQNKSFAPVHSAGRSVDCAGSELVVLVFEQNVERGVRSVKARDVLLQIELVRFAQFVARVHLLLEHSQIIPNHDDLVEECLEPATAGKLISELGITSVPR
jgi:hypothetical protein